MTEAVISAPYKALIRTFVATAFLLFSFTHSFAQNETEQHEEEENPTGFIMHHIKDAHEWHFATIGHKHITLHLPIILYSPDRGLEFFMSSDFVDPVSHERIWHEGYTIDAHEHVVAEDPSRAFYNFSITKNTAMLFLVLFVVGFLALKTASHYKKHPNTAPKGVAAFMEPLVIFIRDEIAKPNIGPKYKRYMPYLLTLFFFVLVANIMGLMPGAANLTGNIAATFVLAIITFIITNVSGNKDYWKHVFATPGVPFYILPVMVVVEFIGLFTKPFSLMIRLFVAITAGHIVILSLIGLNFIFTSYAVGVASSLLVVFINIIELLVATIQAYVFTLFSSMYIGAAVQEHHHADDDVDKALI